MLFGRSQHKDGVCRRFFQRFQKGIECCSGEHVHLVDDEHLVSAHLWRNTHLVDELTDVLHGVVGGGIKFVNVVAALLVEGGATLAGVASIAARRGAEAVDGFGKNAGTCGFSDAARTAKQIGVSQFAGCNGIFQRCGEGVLSHHAVKRVGPVFSCRYDVVAHNRCV